MVSMGDLYPFREADKEEVQYCIVFKLKKYIPIIRLKFIYLYVM